jgi:curved DNA-binding protein CbpA
MRNLYSVLNLSRRANCKDIKTAYWALAKQFHPDVNAGNHDSERWTKEINRAYEILGDPDARTAYDLELAHQRAKARISFWRSAAIGAATFTLTAGSISMAVVWKEHALKIRSAKNETLAPEQKRAASRSARSEQPESGADPVDSAPHPEPPRELPAPTRSAIANAALAAAPSQLAPKVAAAVVKTTTMKTQPSPKGALAEGAVTQQTPLGTTLIETPPGGPYPPWALRNLGRY